jgi:hypothetical protein
VATTNTVNTAGWCVGAFLGSWLIDVLPGQLETAALPFQLASSLPVVFFVSGLLRLLVSGSLLWTFHEARTVERPPLADLVWELPMLKPLGQLLDGPPFRTNK